jgi:HEAT repeat protein
MRLARGDAGQSQQTKALFWLGQTEDERARRLLREVAADTRAAEGVRDAAIFSLGQQGEEEDHRFLRELFGTLTSRRLMDKVLMSVSQGAGREDEASQRWLLAVARDTARALEVRKQAVFWAGQGEAETDDIAALYDDSGERRMREHIIFVLSQRQDDEAADKLMAIAESDPDREMRKKAIFWLGQSQDPRATEFLRRMIAR